MVTAFSGRGTYIPLPCTRQVSLLLGGVPMCSSPFPRGAGGGGRWGSVGVGGGRWGSVGVGGLTPEDHV